MSDAIEMPEVTYTIRNYHPLFSISMWAEYAADGKTEKSYHDWVVTMKLIYPDGEKKYTVGVTQVPKDRAIPETHFVSEVRGLLPSDAKRKVIREAAEYWGSSEDDLNVLFVMSADENKGITIFEYNEGFDE